MTAEKRYLPLFDDQGGWALERPDLYALVRMSVRDDQGHEEVEQAYQYMANSSDNSKPALNGPQAVLERQFIRGKMTERRYSAMVLTELLRLRSNQEEPTLGNALILVAHELRKSPHPATESSCKQQAKTAFSKWRSTCHLELAFRIATTKNGETFEADQAQFMSFLAMAKAFELLMDDVCLQSALTWKPWRVPEQISPALRWEIPALSIEERKLVSAAGTSATAPKR
ncbi:hypothetical protein [Pseudophaeobacter sp. A-200-2]|uniref:hypothetical protein n=1 Tax=Pseudophaeobacter sp. A-200-2 TaxID=3098145 RepID=UPI0034D776F6